MWECVTAAQRQIPGLAMNPNETFVGTHYPQMHRVTWLLWSPLQDMRVRGETRLLISHTETAWLYFIYKSSVVSSAHANLNSVINKREHSKRTEVIGCEASHYLGVVTPELAPALGRTTRAFSGKKKIIIKIILYISFRACRVSCNLSRNLR